MVNLFEYFLLFWTQKGAPESLILGIIIILVLCLPAYLYIKYISKNMKQWNSPVLASDLFLLGAVVGFTILITTILSYIYEFYISDTREQRIDKYESYDMKFTL